MRRPLASKLVNLSLPLLTRLDPERAHDLGLVAARWLRPLWPTESGSAALGLRCLGLPFAHPVGLAAGFDKNADSLDALGAMGFSHVEVGTVTPRPQPGNPKPRMFRLRAQGALVNRMGFNNLGVDHLVARLATSRYRGVRGVSIGKNANTPLERAEDDYLACLRKVYEHADYVAVNVSSPNTARLRELQGRDGLERIVGALLEERRGLAARFGKRVPLLVKVAPDLDGAEISALAAQLKALQVDGVIATNTSSDLSAFTGQLPANPSGGLSGTPLHARSVAVIARLRAALGPEFPIIGVGGIVDAASAAASLAAGANLIQVYTGFAYQGPALIEAILRSLAAADGVGAPGAATRQP
jgi:dihydroorotate dehydrogenase